MHNLILPGTDERKVIALDYDRTANTNIEFWKNFVAYAHASNYDVYIVTMRAENEVREVRLHFEGKVKGIITTAYRAKRSYCAQKRINVDIWIDDSPEYILSDLGQLMDMHIVQGDETHLKGFAFFFNDCIHEGTSVMKSFHRTKAGAYKAMRDFLLEQERDHWTNYLQEERTNWTTLESFPDGPNFPVFEDYCLSKRHRRWHGALYMCAWRVVPHVLTIKE